jgi:hypothetical protein
MDGNSFLIHTVSEIVCFISFISYTYHVVSSEYVVMGAIDGTVRGCTDEDADADADPDRTDDPNDRIFCE